MRAHRLLVLIATYPLGLVALSIVNALAPQRQGTLALLQIFAPHLFLAAVPLIPLAVLARHRVLVSALAVALVVAALRFGPEWVSVPGAPGAGTPLRVVTWNLELDGRSPDSAVAGLVSTDADVVALQELGADVAAAIDAHPDIAARFPHRVLVPRPGVLGMGLLSRYPVTAAETISDPAAIVARLDFGGGRTLAVANAHPLPGRITTVGELRLPIAFDATARDAALHRIRARIDELLRLPEPVVVVGDFNVAPTEPAYRDVAAGLRDAHLDAGIGPGWTYRPDELEGLPIGLVRIDYVFADAGVRPLSSAVDCAHGGDHCRVIAVLELPWQPAPT